MDKKIARRWVKALISGKYKQGKSALVRDVGGQKQYCCLGVLCDITKKQTGGEWVARRFSTNANFNVGADSDDLFPPFSVRELAGIDYDFQHKLANMNDGAHPDTAEAVKPKSFRQIARFIAETAGITVKELQPKPRVKKTTN